MTQITINIENPEDETFIETFLKKMKISFSKSEDDDFEFTEEMKRVCDEAKKQDPTTYRDAFEALEKIAAKHGI